MNLAQLTVSEILKHFEDKSLRSLELTKYYLNNIKTKNKEYNVFLSIRNEEEILDEARKADEARKNGAKKPLLGIPFALKDSYMAVSTSTTAADLYLKETQSEYEATIVKRLLEAGGILLGKLNMDAWGFGSSTENSSYGVTKNPFDRERVAGGSSGGAAASIALEMCAFTIAEDTGGSCRNPASFTGLYGLKPTYGRIPRFGCIAYASSLDTVAPIARSSEDLKIIFDVIAGSDNHDMTVEDSKPQEVKLKRKFAYSYDFIPKGLNEDTKRIYLDTINRFKATGYKAVECSIKSLAFCIPTYYITAMSESSTNLSRYQGTRYGYLYKQLKEKGLGSKEFEEIKSWEELYTKARTEGFNSEAKRRILLGSYVLSEGYYDAYYKKAQKIRNLIKQEIEEVLESVDFILSPVTPAAAPKIGEKLTSPVEMYLEDIYTVTANLAGIPSVAFPGGRDKNNLPIGMQIMGNKFDDEKLLEILKDIKSLASN